MTSHILFFTILFVFSSSLILASIPEFYFNAGENATISIGDSKELMRSVGSAGGIQVYRVCDGKNAKTCGYWEDTKTKKKVANAPVTKKVGQNLILEKVTDEDSGSYYNDGDIYFRVQVFNSVVQGK
ncbi:unnamed protein product [Caenorhabditis angaria]|uniref:Uncharacterized protein n=1 Tax=Caenorhabditis angaria TaxID=860376 RepID=A0A9P1NCY1_9PELO|nr:unnamed protein product [Caenorhabditis angaria]